jgi:WD40 repeat protein
MSRSGRFGEFPGHALAGALFFSLLGLACGVGRAQDEIRNFKKPLLMVETGGHHAPVRSVIWQDPRTMLTGGLDKVVKVWDLQDGAHLARTLRPMIWRGPAGIIYAIALSPVPDAAGQRLLAVGGFGVENRRGDLTIYRVPGVERVPTGEVVARLMPPRTNDPREPGHRDSVLCLAFDPTGRILASGGNDSTVQLWDVTRGPQPAIRSRAILTAHRAPVRTLAFSPDGRTLATAGADGSIRLWEVATGRELSSRSGNARNPDPINTLAFSPDGQSIAVGLEGGPGSPGRLYVFDGRDLARPAVQLPTRAEQGPVECLAFQPDGRRLALSIKSDRSDVLDPMTISCDLEIRSLPDGAVARTWKVHGLVYACSFSPAGDRLAYSGGPAQSIFLQNMADLDQVPEELKGQGSTPFDLGFKSDEPQVIAFTRDRPAPGNAPGSYEGFDLAARKTRDVPAAQVQRALRTFGGWTLQGSINQYVLEAVNADGRRWRVALDGAKERLWWSWTFVPPGPGHPRGTVAIGTEAGVALFDLETGGRTRVFAGHSSPVVSVVPSPDGRWLASSSIDQAVMLYPLAGCDTRPGLGATFQQVDGAGWRVERIEPGGFAASMGLLPGDMLMRAVILAGRSMEDFQKLEEIARFVARVDQLAPYVEEIGLRVHRTMAVPVPGLFGVHTVLYQAITPFLPSSKRNNPALTLMLGSDKEWVLWTPQGYYDTSIEGDFRLLGWHINSPFDSTQPTDYVPLGTYARTMNRPEVLERLWTTGSIDQALAAVAAREPRPDAQAYDDQPPKIVLSSAQPQVKPQAPGKVWEVTVPRPAIKVDLLALGKRKIQELRLIVDEKLLPVRKLALKEQHEETVELELPPNKPVRVEVQATNEQQAQRVESIDLVYLPPPMPVPPQPEAVRPTPAPEKPKPTPRLVLLGFGSERFQVPQLGAIRFAEKDLADVAAFLGQHLLMPSGSRPGDLKLDRVDLLGARATAQAMESALERLQAMPRSGELQKGDLVVVLIASHVLAWEGSSLIASADSQATVPLKPSISARDLSERLGELADYGCRVVAILDGVHESPDAQIKSDVKAWVRDLQRNRRVITFIASKEGPGGVSVRDQHSYFALGLLGAFQAGGASGARRNRTAPYTIDQYRRAAAQQVQDLSNRRQELGCFIPTSVPPSAPFVAP